eukprot:TRINITY_DN3025_c0_g1_i2.p1 TRINITY_DN3025_c0_g1~~TRINITY_DN3025_c0_g1_i2.p1  ORF type:complete len:369 (-),score=127.94 TRINITY_DN3025_c0_g1_i2:203-1309(-)
MELTVAIQQGDAALLRQLLDERPERAAQAVQGGVTLLHWACDSGALDCVQVLIEKNVYEDLNDRDASGATPLHWAAAEGRNECVTLLLDRQALVDPVDNAGETPLHWAALNNRKSTVDLLIRHGARVNVQATNGATPLHAAAVNSCVECIALLLNCQADPSLRDKSGKTARDVAASKPKNSTVLDCFSRDRRTVHEKLLESEELAKRLQTKLNVSEADHEETKRKLVAALRESIVSEQRQAKMQKEIESLQYELDKQRRLNDLLPNLLKASMEQVKSLKKVCDLQTQTIEAQDREKATLERTLEQYSLVGDVRIVHLHAEEQMAKLELLLTQANQLASLTTSTVERCNDAVSAAHATAAQNTGDGSAQ